MCVPLDDSHCDRCGERDFNFPFLMISNGEHLFICLRAICVSSLEDHPFSSPACILIRLFVLDVEFHELLVYVDYESLVGDPRIFKATRWAHFLALSESESEQVLDVGAFSEAEMPTL